MAAGRRAGVAATVVVAALSLSPAVAAHVDPGFESEVLGAAHAEDHAREDAYEAAREAWWRFAPTSARRRALTRARRDARPARSTAGAEPLDVQGSWSLPVPLPESAIHAALVPTGEVLIWGRQPLVDGTRPNVGRAWLWSPDHPLDPIDVRPPAIEDANGDGLVDTRDERPAIYCSSQSLLPDGRLLVVGGNLADPSPPARPDYAGRRETFLFAAWSRTWQRGPDMRRGRWYPSQVELADGRIAILGGIDERGQGDPVPELELYRPEIGGPGTIEHVAAGDRSLELNGADTTLYPHLTALPDGTVALTGPLPADSAVLDLSRAGAGPGNAWAQLGSSPATRVGGNAVLLPDPAGFAGSWRILLLGGAPIGAKPRAATATTELIDLAPGADGAWRAGPSTVRPRHYANTVLLPDGSLVTVGGGAGVRDEDGNYWVGTPVDETLRAVELYDPTTGQWRLGAAQAEWRTYHSVALLLPDGRVFSAGDDRHEGADPEEPLPRDPPEGRRDSAELYSPPYLFDGDRLAPRPSLDRAPTAIAYGATFAVGVRPAGNPARPVVAAVLVAPGSPTHGVDMSQRLVPLHVVATRPDELELVAPASGAIAPPGHYMLFVLDSTGTPSVARWIVVDETVPPAPASHPAPAPTAPAPIPPAPPPPAPAAPPPAPPAGRLVLQDAARLRSDGTVRILVACPAGTAGGCAGELVVRASPSALAIGASAAPRGRTPVRLGTGSFRARQGAVARVAVPIAPRGIAALVLRGELRAALTLRVRAGAGGALRTVNRTVRLLAPRRP